MTLGLVSFTELGGVPATPAPRKIGRAFLATVDAAFEDLWESCPLGVASRVVHGGAYVDRPDPNGVDRHAQGRAIDIMHLEFGSLHIGPQMITRSRADLRRYLAVSAVLIQKIGCVLLYWQPEHDGTFKHRSHWHLDDHVRAGEFSPHWASSVRFIQAALLHVWDEDCGPSGIDGHFGSKTNAALDRVLAAQSIVGEDWWMSFLRATAARGFAG